MYRAKTAGRGRHEVFDKQMHRTSSAWRSPSVELAVDWSRRAHATTLTEDAASGGDLVIPQYVPGIQPVLFGRLVVADLIAPGTTTLISGAARNAGPVTRPSTAALKWAVPLTTSLLMLAIAFGIAELALRRGAIVTSPYLRWVPQVAPGSPGPRRLLGTTRGTRASRGCCA